MKNDLAGYVNPFIGTDAHGHTFPGATVPFGMVQLSPDTGTEGWDWCSGYHYSDSSIMGFSHTHLSGTGCADYGDILIMPAVGELGIKGDSSYRSSFSHDSEEASPGYYSVMLEDYKVKAELTATERTGIHRYTFPESEEAHILLDLSHGIGDRTTDACIKIVGDSTIEGYRRSSGWNDHRVYFFAQFSKPFSSYGTWNGESINEGRGEETGEDIGCFVNYDTKNRESIVIKVGISYTGIDGAGKNLEEEAKGWDFDNYREKARDAWNEKLGKIEVKGEREDMIKFYTALYHCMIAPNIFSDVDGSYIGIDWKIHRTDTTQYTLFSLWDTFRALNPLLVLMEPEVEEDIIRSMLRIYEDSGEVGLPRWFLANTDNNCMIGTHSEAVIADAYMKGLRGFDVELAYRAMKTDGEKPGDADLAKEGKPWGRLGLQDYISSGYIPINTVGQEVSRTLEYAYDDFCIAQMAKALGKEEDYEIFSERAKNYRNLFDSSTGFMNGRYLNGSWFRPMNMNPLPSDYFFTPDGKNGLKGEYFNNMNLSGKPELTRIDKQINFDWQGSPAENINKDEFSVRWSGKLSLPESVNEILLTTDDGARVFIDDRLALDRWQDRSPTTDVVPLKGGHRYSMTIEYYEHGGGATARLEFLNGYLPFDPTVQYPFYTEGNAWQWSFFAPQDIDGLIELMGGSEKFIEKLDSMFEQPSVVKGSPDISGLIGQYAHGNEPSHHIAYLYDHAGAPWKTQEKVREIMEELYGTEADGLCGNEDCGQMSAWYVFSAMGFYPTCPGTPLYDLGSPVFEEVKIHLQNGKTFTVKANNASKENVCVLSYFLNDKSLERAWIDHKEIVLGGQLVLEMGNKPVKSSL
ncbi:MAG: GH92 family glycosyl hydrolase [Candidatus Thermoplasmatota archaeon]|nr:GH92 family glycosyl hydrolase [Candidatus Thermoplasmatota archaeon]